MEPSIIKRIGEQVGAVEEVDVGEGGLCVGKFARVRVTRRIDEPLVRCVPLKNAEMAKEVIVLLQYEKLPEFCFLCGRVGHISRDCRDTSVDKHKPRFDSWLRAGRSFAGRRSAGVGSREVVMGSPSGSRVSGLGRGEARLEERELEQEERDEMGKEKGGEQAPATLAIVEREREGGISDENHDMCMDDFEGMGVRVEQVVEEHMLSSLSPNLRLDRGKTEMGERGGASAKGKTKYKSPVKMSLKLGKGGGKGWKRLAREKKPAESGRSGGLGDDDRSGTCGEDGKKKRYLKRREGHTGDLEESEGEMLGPKAKQIKLRDENVLDLLPAVAATQPRQSL